MRVKDFECRSYKEAEFHLFGLPSRKVCNNTELHRTSGSSIGLYLYNTQIVRFYKEGPITIVSGGHLTEVTKNRINCCLPIGYRLIQRKGVWVLNGAKVPEPGRTFVDGMEVG